MLSEQLLKGERGISRFQFLACSTEDSVMFRAMALGTFIPRSTYWLGDPRTSQCPHTVVSIDIYGCWCTQDLAISPPVEC